MEWTGVLVMEVQMDQKRVPSTSRRPSATRRMPRVPDGVPEDDNGRIFPLQTAARRVLASAFHEVWVGMLLITQGALSSRENAAV
jgi:hypothetical protein